MSKAAAKKIKRVERPWSARELDVPAFTAWLSSRGATILETKSSYEVIRCKLGDELQILYRQESNRLTWPDELAKAWLCYATNIDWSALDKTKRMTTQRRHTQVKRLAARDGWECFYCAAILTVETATVEHLVAVLYSGPNHEANFCLACEKCNLEAGHLGVVEKVKLRDLKRKTVAICLQA